MWAAHGVGLQAEAEASLVKKSRLRRQNSRGVSRFLGSLRPPLSYSQHDDAKSQLVSFLLQHQFSPNASPESRNTGFSNTDAEIDRGRRVTSARACLEKQLISAEASPGANRLELPRGWHQCGTAHVYRRVMQQRLHGCTVPVNQTTRFEATQRSIRRE